MHEGNHPLRTADEGVLCCSFFFFFFFFFFSLIGSFDPAIVLSYIHDLHGLAEGIGAADVMSERQVAKQAFWMLR